uniref:histidine kinase n=1 Tax=Rheinheimera sp. BAL341 TaxID=1708203 RepID=A0A486XJT7_9GAMM
MALLRLKAGLTKRRPDSQQRLDLLAIAITVLLLAIQYVLWPDDWRLSIAIVAGGILLCVLQRKALAPLKREINALNLHAQNLQDGSFNTSANQLRINELSALANSLNLMSAQLRAERATLYQRELLLDTVLQSSPSAMLLTDANNTVLMSNPAARRLLSAGKPFDGAKLQTVLSKLPQLRTAIEQQQSGILHLADNSIWHLSLSQFQLNQQQHQLILLKPMTREIQREELSAWKKLLRVIGHELNNTLAPLSSLAYSGEQRASQLQQAELTTIFSTINDRSQALNQFVQAYIQFAKLPKPTLGLVNWPRLINQLQDLYDFELEGELPKAPWQADANQLQQALLNILKNAHESGSAPQQITLQFHQTPQYLCITIQDNGGGMTEEQLQHALVPFYTSKAGGSGIGLTLCRDIVEAHHGSISLRNTAKGLEVTLKLPASH